MDFSVWGTPSLWPSWTHSSPTSLSELTWQRWLGSGYWLRALKHWVILRMARNEGTIPDTSTLSKSIKKTLPPCSPNCWRQIPWLWNKTHPFYGRTLLESSTIQESQDSFSIFFFFYRVGRDQIRSEEWRGMAEGNHSTFPESFEFTISLLASKNKDRNFFSDQLQWKESTTFLEPPNLWTYWGVKKHGVDHFRRNKTRYIAHQIL